MVSVVTGRVLWFGNYICYANYFCMVSVVTVACYGLVAASDMQVISVCFFFFFFFFL